MRSLLTTNFYQRFLTGFGLGIIFWAIFVYFPPIYFSILLVAILLVIITYEWTKFFPVNQSTFWLTVPFYPTLPFLLLIALNHHPLYHRLLYILFILVFSFDTGSYLFGTVFGKHTIYPTISRNKTWEGFWGGYLCAVFGLMFIIWEQSFSFRLPTVFLFTFLICILSLSGDLFESWLKRKAHLKDSSNLLPGHGGFLDRFDGILFTVFFFYFFRQPILSLFWH